MRKLKDINTHELSLIVKETIEFYLLSNFHEATTLDDFLYAIDCVNRYFKKLDEMSDEIKELILDSSEAEDDLELINDRIFIAIENKI
jgi:hypothetical protein